MPTIVLLTSSSFLSYKELITSAHTLADQLDATLIVTDNLDDIYQRPVDLLLWMPGRFDAKVYNQLYALCPRIVFLGDVRTRTGRFGPPPEGTRLLPFDVITIIAPFQDFETVCFLIKAEFGWPPSDSDARSS